MSNDHDESRVCPDVAELARVRADSASSDPELWRVQLQERLQSRRQLLSTAGGGFGALALRWLLERDGVLAAENTGSTNSSPATHSPLAPRLAHFAPRAKSVIFLFMYGGPSQVDLFDPKPELTKYDGRPIPTFKPEDAFNSSTKNVALRSPFRFRKHGQAGIDVAETFPHLAQCVDDICVVRSMHCESNNHAPALFQMNSGFLLSGRPCLGSWVTYGLGSESDNLPAFVVLLDHQGAPINGALNWSNGFMPATYQGVTFRPTGEPIAYLQPPKNVTSSQQRARLKLLQQWNAEYAATHPAESSLAARVASYELAYRMQTEAADCVDLENEPAWIRERYGLNDSVSKHFGRNCLLARRMIERGVRFVQVYSGGNEGPRAWDAHDDIRKNHELHCAETDRPIAALLNDLKERGLLDETLVIWGGEFGRSPVAQASKGRDHHPHGFTMWLAGGGIRGGQVYGATDDFGYHAVEKRVSVPDLHATILHLLGFDHTRLTYRHNGRDYRLTDVAGEVMREWL